MIPDPDATNHLSFKLEYRQFSPDLPNQLMLLENQINLMAQSGWQLDKIMPWKKGYVLIVYSGLVDNNPCVVEP